VAGAALGRTLTAQSTAAPQLSIIVLVMALIAPQMRLQNVIRPVHQAVQQMMEAVNTQVQNVIEIQETPHGPEGAL